MRVLFFLRSLLHGGTERQVAVLARVLRKQGHQVRVATLYGGDAFAQDFVGAGIVHEMLGKRGRFDLIQPHLRLIRLVRSWAPDVVYSFLPAQNLAAVMLSPLFGGAKLILGVRAADLNLKEYDWLAGLSYRLEPWIARCADLVIANSTAGKRWCEQRGFPQQKLCVVPNGIETNKFCFDDNARYVLRSELGIGAETLFVVMIARLDIMKGYQSFLRAAAQLAQSSPNMMFACIGNGPTAYMTKLQSLATELGLERRLLWLPAQEKVEAMLSAADIGVLSSSFGEGFPNIVVEGMACGLPMVVTDTGDCRIIINKLLPVAPPSDPTALAAAIERTVEIVRGEPSLKAVLRQHVEANYSADKLGAAMEEILVALCRGY